MQDGVELPLAGAWPAAAQVGGDCACKVRGQVQVHKFLKIRRGSHTQQRVLTTGGGPA